MTTKSALFIGYLCVCFWSTPSTWGAAPEEIIQKTKEAYSGPASQFKDPSYFYNLGSAYLALGRIPLSYVYLKRAHELAPQDRDTEYQFGIAQKEIDQHGKSSPNTFLEALGAWDESFGLSLFFSLLGLVLVFWLRPELRVEALRQGDGTLWMVILLFVCAGFTVLGRTLHQTHKLAGTLEAQILMSGPGAQFLQLGRIEEGEMLRILLCTDGWCQIRYRGSGDGLNKAWAKESSLLLFGGG